MIQIKKMKKTEVPILFDIALKAFQPDFEKYGTYPPLLNQKKKKFLPLLFLGKQSEKMKQLLVLFLYWQFEKKVKLVPSSLILTTNIKVMVTKS